MPSPRWQPGESGNPGGLARNVRIPRLANLVGVGTPKQIAKRLVDNALKGDPKVAFTGLCLRILCDRLWPALREGMTTQSGVITHEHKLHEEVSKYLTRDELKQIAVAAKEITRKSVDEVPTPRDEPTLQ